MADKLEKINTEYPYRCKKCSLTSSWSDVKLKYVGEISRIEYPKLYLEEHIEVTCPRCGWMERRAVADAL